MLKITIILATVAVIGLAIRKFRKPNGTALISTVKSKFQALIDDLENGVADNRTQSDANSATIVALGHENTELERHASHGESIAQRLRELLGETE